MTGLLRSVRDESSRMLSQEETIFRRQYVYLLSLYLLLPPLSLSLSVSLTQDALAPQEELLKPLYADTEAG